MSITIKDIARELHLSESAVSLALNQRPGVSDATRQRVIACARSLGYDLGRLRARGNAGRSVLLVHYQKRIHAPVAFFSTLLAGAERELRKSDISLVSLVVDGNLDVPSQLERHISHGCAGIIVLATEMDGGNWSHFSSLGMPVVLLRACLTRRCRSPTSASARTGSSAPCMTRATPPPRCRRSS